MRLILPTAAVLILLAGCARVPAAPESAMEIGFVVSPIRVMEHRGGDNLLSAGLGLAGLAGLPSPITDPVHPTASELRRRAIQMNWKGIADLGPLGGYGRVYGAIPNIPGREFSAFAKIPGARSPHRVLVQAPDNFDSKKRCLLVAPSSGSRGIYGAISLASAWGLPRGCAVAYTDKGTGSGYFDTADNSGVALDGTRAKAGTAQLEFEPVGAPTDAGIGIKHVHSGDNPEADWGHHVLQAARFGLAMLNRAYPDQAPFTPENTRIIATGLSNGGGAVLQAAGFDDAGLLDGVVAMEPNINVPGHGRTLFDYATQAALLMPCALLDPRFDDAPLARVAGMPPPAWPLRCASLHNDGTLSATALSKQAAQALEQLHASGWRDDAIATAASTTLFDIWRAAAAGYASAYLRRGVGNMACGFVYRAMNGAGVPIFADAATRASWWSDAAGIPPGAGVGLFGGVDASLDPTLRGVRCLRDLWDGDNADARAVHASVDTVIAKMPRANLPIWIVHGAGDGLIPTAFSSEPYVAWLREHGRTPRYWRVRYAQHFDAFLAMPGFGDAHVPLMPFAYAALDRMAAHLFDGEPLVDPPTPQTRPRGAGALEAGMLGLSP